MTRSDQLRAGAKRTGRWLRSAPLFLVLFYLSVRPAMAQTSATEWAVEMCGTAAYGYFMGGLLVFVAVSVTILTVVGPLGAAMMKLAGAISSTLGSMGNAAIIGVLGAFIAAVLLLAFIGAGQGAMTVSPPGECMLF